MKGKLLRSALPLILATMLLAGCTLTNGVRISADPMTAYREAMARTSTIKGADETAIFTMTVDGQELLTFEINARTDKKKHLSAGSMKTREGDHEESFGYFTDQDFLYIERPDGIYHKMPLVGTQVTTNTATDYADRLSKLIGEDPGLKATVTKTTADLKVGDKIVPVTRVAFTLPADRTQAFIRDMAVLSMTSKDTKERIIDEATAQLRKSYDAKISVVEVRLMVEREIEKMIAAIDQDFAALTFTELKYVASINKQGLVIKQDLSYGWIANEKQMTAGLSYLIRNQAASPSVELPVFTEENTIQINSLMTMLP